MSMSADIHDTILSFCIANNIAQDKAIALLRDIVDDMNGDGDSYDFSFVANVYASEQASRPTKHALDVCRYRWGEGMETGEHSYSNGICGKCGKRQ